ncbi:hypothetical protein [Streptomyces sp. NPDC001820]|uniref:hypothetical protein n=1 Tax=Streptomyces sp. NPDC001820 TaxID=3364613 RepID=UPI0036B2207D
MTQSGQGDEQQQPASRPAHEGVVLPADGSEPWIPGVSDAQVAPAGGQPWGEPWGPEQQPGRPGPPADGGPVAQRGWGEAPQAGYGGQPLPPQGGYDALPPAPGGYDALPPAPGGYGALPPAQSGYDAQSGYGQQQGQAPQDAYDAPPQGGYGSQPLPPQGRASHTAYDGQSQGQVPQDAYDAPRQGQAPQGGYGSQPLPPQGRASHTAYDGQSQGQAPQDAYGGQSQGQASQSGYGSQPLPQALPPQAVPMGDSDATQYIPPVAPGAMPPETPAESTQFLGAVPAQASVPGPDADATQYIAPVPPAPAAAPFGIRPGAPEDRQPPAEFDSLFRTDAPAAQAPDATQQLPQFEAPHAGNRPPRQQQYQQQQYQQPQAPQGPERESRRRKSSHVPVIAAVVVGCAVLGLGVSAVMFGGDEERDPGAGKNVAATSDAPSSDPKAADDPAKSQAEALDKLLADSNNSRAAVIRSVENIKRCQNLDQAATDLSGAAQQRRGLVTRLGGLTVDKLPSHAQLTASLTKAWQASASADDHYAAWAQQVKGKKGCKDGRARSTGQTAQAERASGDATKAKKEASGLWNSIAGKYGLTERRSEQL